MNDPRDLADRILAELQLSPERISRSELARRCGPFGVKVQTAVACAELGRNCLSAELSAKYCGIARRRIQEALAAGPLSDDAMAFDLVHPSHFQAHPPVKIYPLDQVPFIKVA